MKRIKEKISLIFFVCICLLNIVNPIYAQKTVKDTTMYVQNLFLNYPNASLMDIYKDFYQSIYGSEHLVTNYDNVIKFIEQEITEEYDDNQPLYQYVGMNQRFVRVNIACVKNGYISKQTLANCFIESSQIKDTLSIEQFRKQFHIIIKEIYKLNPNLTNFLRDMIFIESLLDKNMYACSHSIGYKEKYKPHYRIIHVDIFKDKILKYLPKSK